MGSEFAGMRMPRSGDRGSRPAGRAYSPKRVGGCDVLGLLPSAHINLR